MVAHLTELTRQYRKQGDVFFARPAGAAERERDYFGTADEPGLLGLFKQIKGVAADILRINQENMEEANSAARAEATKSLTGFGAGLAAIALLGSWLASQLTRSILRPIAEITDAAVAVGAGQYGRAAPHWTARTDRGCWAAMDDRGALAVPQRRDRTSLVSAYDGYRCSPWPSWRDCAPA